MDVFGIQGANNDIGGQGVHTPIIQRLSPARDLGRKSGFLVPRSMQSIVLSSLLSVGLLIAISFVVGHADWMRAEATKDLGRLVFMCSQRYNVAEELVSAGVVVSTALAIGTVSLVMALAGHL